MCSGLLIQACSYMASLRMVRMCIESQPTSTPMHGPLRPAEKRISCSPPKSVQTPWERAARKH